MSVSVFYYIPQCYSEVVYYFQCLFAHCSLSCLCDWHYFCYCLMCIFAVCCSYCFLCEHCLTDNCGWEICLYVHGFQSVYMSLRGSVTVCLSNWSKRYCIAVICVVFMYMLFLVVICPVFVMLQMYDLLLWLWYPFSTNVPLIHGPPSSNWITTVDPFEIKV